MNNNEAAPEFVEIEGVQYVPNEEDPTIAKEENGEKVKFVKKADAPVDPHKDETPEARSARLTRMSDQHDKKHKLGKYKEGAGDDGKNKTDKKSKGLGYDEKAYLQSHDLKIKSKEEFEFVEKAMEDTGKTLEQIIGNKFFQSELAEMREASAVEDATPGDGNDRSGTSTRDSVEYWIKKGELPPDTKENAKLRQQVVAKKRSSAGQASTYTDNAVISKNKK